MPAVAKPCKRMDRSQCLVPRNNTGDFEPDDIECERCFMFCTNCRGLREAAGIGSLWVLGFCLVLSQPRFDCREPPVLSSAPGTHIPFSGYVPDVGFRSIQVGKRTSGMYSA